MTDPLSKGARDFVEARRKQNRQKRRGYEPEWLELIDEIAPRKVEVNQLSEGERHCVEEFRAIIPPRTSPEYCDTYCYVENVLRIVDRRFPPEE